MILRKPTAIPLRPQDLQEFQDHLRAQQEAAKGTSSREGSAMTVDKEGGASVGTIVQHGEQQRPVDASEAARRARAQRTARERIGVD